MTALVDDPKCMHGAERPPEDFMARARLLKGDLAQLLAERECLQLTHSNNVSISIEPTAFSNAGREKPVSTTHEKAAKPKNGQNCCICHGPAAFGVGWFLHTPDSDDGSVDLANSPLIKRRRSHDDTNTVTRSRCKSRSYLDAHQMAKIYPGIQAASYRHPRGHTHCSRRKSSTAGY